MADTSERLLQLRPVKFRYKKAEASGEKPIQYGLIAEEVAKVYPELVVRDAATGRIDGVRYDELAPMLLNEVQQQQRKNETQAAEIGELKKRQLITEAEQMRMRQQVAELKDLKEQIALMAAALHTLEAKDKVVARR
jgi:septation ring formation regulator EzrA